MLETYLYEPTQKIILI